MERIYNENPGDNLFIPPTKDNWGFCKSKVKVEYNVWAPDGDRQARDFDRVVLVIYYKDALSDWHIAKSNTNQNGADPEGNVNEGKVIQLKGSSKGEPDPDKKKISAIAILEANPDFNQPGYEASKDVKEIRVIVVTLKPDDKKVPKDPLGANFAVPD